MLDSDSTLLSINEIAQRLQLPERAIEGFIARGELHPESPDDFTVLVSEENLTLFYDNHRIIR